MKTKQWLTGCLLMVLINSCSTPAYLPKTREIDINQYGSYINILRVHADAIKGELLAIDSVQFVVLTYSMKGNKVLFVPIETMKSFKLRYARPRHYEWTIPLFAYASLFHGWYVAFTGPINLLGTIGVSIGGESAFTYSNKNMTLDKLKMFARFPQGIPPNVNIALIK